MSKFDIFPKPSAREAGLEDNPEWHQYIPLYNELLDDIKNNLPGKPYVGNCTKEFCEKIIDLYIDKEFERIQSIHFPSSREYPITIEQCDRELLKLASDDDMSKKNSWNTIRYFHKSIIEANREGCLSPVEGWETIKRDKAKFRVFYHNRLRCSDWYKEKKWQNLKYLVMGYVPEFIYGIGLSTSRKFPEVSYFKPGLAKYLIEKYLGEFDYIFDPFSGYSGRLLGALAAGKGYTGQDLCEKSIEEGKALASHYFDLLVKNDKLNKVKRESEDGKLLLGQHWSLRVKDSENDHGDYQCLFTCSPYKNIENWPGVPSRGYSSDEWIHICLKNFKCKKYVFVVDGDIMDYKSYVVETIENTSHFGKNFEYVVVIDGDNLPFGDRKCVVNDLGHKGSFL